MHICVCVCVYVCVHISLILVQKIFLVLVFSLPKYFSFYLLLVQGIRYNFSSNLAH